MEKLLPINRENREYLAMKSKLMDKMAMAVDSPREKGRLENIKKAWVELAEYLHMPWWKRWFRRDMK